jgi:hypothetical protein
MLYHLIGNMLSPGKSHYYSELPQVRMHGALPPSLLLTSVLLDS